MKRSHSIRFISLTSSLLVFQACTDEPTALSAARNSETVFRKAAQLQPRHRIMTVSEELADELPSFGGMYVEKGVLNIFLTDEKDVQTFTQAVSLKWSRRRPTNLQFHFRKADFSFRDLDSFQKRLIPSINAIPGVSIVWIDQWTNRLDVGVATPLARAAVMTAIVREGVPPQAVAVKNVPYFEPTGRRNLRDEIPTLVGGIEIRVASPHGETGTLGAIVQVGGVTYALIASHVADNTGSGETGAAVYQNATGRKIGNVAVNPPWNESLPGCNSTMKCRETDVALVLLDPGISYNFGAIAKPLGGPSTSGPGSQIFDDNVPTILDDDWIRCTVYGCTLDWVPGTFASKIGARSGWTGGSYAGSAYLPTSNDGLYRASVYLFFGTDSVGDSGAPVLMNGKLGGIAFAKGVQDGNEVFLISDWPSIGNELAGSQWAIHSVPPYMLGFEPHYTHPASCPANPDAQDYYLIYGYPTGSGGYETRTSAYMGSTGYWCGGQTVYSNLQDNVIYQSCQAHFGGDCPCAGFTSGGQCFTYE